MEDKFETKSKKPCYKRVWFWILVVFIVGGIGSFFDDENSSADLNVTNLNVTKIYTSVSVDQLYDALENNAAAAKDIYNGKYLEIGGRLGVIDSDLKYISLLSATDSWDLMGIHCNIKNQSTRDTVKSLSKNQIITVKGKITDVGEILGYFLDIDEIR